MICFDVLLNGERLTRAGVRDGVFAVIVDHGPPGAPTFSVRGMSTARSRHYAHLKWLSSEELEPGDELAVRVVEASRPHPPSQRERSLPREGHRGENKVTFAECSFCSRDRPHKLASGAIGGTLGSDTFLCRNCACVARLMKEQRAPEALHFRRVAHGTCALCKRRRRGVLQGKAAGICTTCLRRVVREM